MSENDKKHLNMLEELLAYRAIGTIEEFRALKENKRKCEECAGCTEWLCDCANIRAKAIDEFAVELKNFMRSNVEDAEYFGDCCCEIYESEIDEIAEHMKGGGNDVETN